MSAPAALLVIVAFLPPELLICPEEAVKKRRRGPEPRGKEPPVQATANSEGPG
jgi:hypothetical protein